MTATFDNPDDRRSRLRRAIDAVLAETPPEGAVRRSLGRARRIGKPTPRKWYGRASNLLLVAAVAATVLLGSMFATDNVPAVGTRSDAVIGTDRDPGAFVSGRPVSAAIVPFAVRPTGQDVDSAGNDRFGGSAAGWSEGWTRIGIDELPGRQDCSADAPIAGRLRLVGRQKFAREAWAWSPADETKARCRALIDATPDAEFAARQPFGRPLPPDVSGDPDDGLPQAFALLALKQYDAAVAHLTPYVEAHPDESLLHRLLAQALSEQGRHGRAAVHSELARSLAGEGSYSASAREEARSLRRRVPADDTYEALREAMGPAVEDVPADGVRIALTWAGLSAVADLNVTDADGRELPATRPERGGRHGPAVVTADTFPLEVRVSLKRRGHEPCVPALARVEMQRAGGPPVVKSVLLREVGDSRLVATIRAVR